MLSIIAAVAKNNVIGKDNKLLWNIPEDLRRFKQITKNHTIIMGRKTFESLGRVLPERKHIVLSIRGGIDTNDENVEVLDDISKLEPYINSEEECFVIGGGSIYNILMPYSNKMYITKVNHEFEGDTHFPEIDESVWKLVSSEKGPQDDENPYDYDFLIYERMI